MPFYYLSLQYSAIQKTVLRHSRLWSIAGISQGLARLNEIVLPSLVKPPHKVLVCGGGKFTARFNNEPDAETARDDIVREISIDFPMLEYQITDVEEAESFADIREKILDTLRVQKQGFRGYGTTYLPHLAVCHECGEYPAEDRFKVGKEKVCRTCFYAHTHAKVNKTKGSTTLQSILDGYYEICIDAPRKPLLEFEHMNPANNNGNAPKERTRMAVWMSDLNNMNQKVPIWLKQPEPPDGDQTGAEAEVEPMHTILSTFDKVTKVNIEIVANALSKTFNSTKVDFKSRDYLPFRLVVAGGDDLCIVMPEEYVLAFARNFSQIVSETIAVLDDNHPLSTKWLEERRDSKRQPNPHKPYSFGASFIITPTHTPFHKIHQVGEELMGIAKKETDRWGNSVNWRIMADDSSVTDKVFTFERPLFIDKFKDAKADRPTGWNRLSLAEYMEMCEAYRRNDKLSSSLRFALIRCLSRWGNDPERFEIELKKSDPKRSKFFSELLIDKRLRPQGRLIPERFATLLELMNIKTAGKVVGDSKGGVA